MELRLAFREEDALWNCYVAKPDTMLDARLIGSIGIGVVKSNPEIKRDFMELMKRVFVIAVKETTGGDVSGWTEKKGVGHRARQ